MPEVIINGEDGRIEGRYHPGKGNASPIALILHPHPQFRGTMNNKVVYTIYQTFAKRGFSVLRFNFRGVGRSQGSYDGGQGELSDAASALDWLQMNNPNAAYCWVAGFSFGAWISMQLLMRRPEIDGFVAVAPPTNRFDFGFLAPCPSSGMIIHGTSDELVPEADVQKLADKLAAQKAIKIVLHKIPKANHFFEDRLDELASAIDDYLVAAIGKNRVVTAG